MTVKRDPPSPSWSRALPVAGVFKSGHEIARALAAEYKVKDLELPGLAVDEDKDRQHPVAMAAHHFWRQDYDKAIAGFKSVVEGNPASAACWEALAACYREQGRWQVAAAAYKRVAALAPDDDTPLLEEAACELLAEDPRAAMAACAIVLARRPGHARALVFKAIAREQQGARIDAHDIAASVTSTHPRDALAWFTRGRLIFDNGASIKEACAALEQAVKHGKDELRYVQYLAKALKAAGDEKGARRALMEALDIAPRDEETLELVNRIGRYRKSTAVEEFARTIPSRSLKILLLTFFTVACAMVVMATFDENAGGIERAFAVGPYPILLLVMIGASVPCLALLRLKGAVASRDERMKKKGIPTGPAGDPGKSTSDREPELKHKKVRARRIVMVDVPDITARKRLAAWWFLEGKRARGALVQLAIAIATSLLLGLWLGSGFLRGGLHGQVAAALAILAPVAVFLVTRLIIAVGNFDVNITGLIARLSPISRKVARAISIIPATYASIGIGYFLINGPDHVRIFLGTLVGMVLLSICMVLLIKHAAAGRVDARFREILEERARGLRVSERSWLYDARDRLHGLSREPHPISTYAQFREYLQRKANSNDGSITITEIVDGASFDDIPAKNGKIIDIDHYLAQLISVALQDGLIVATSEPGVFTWIRPTTHPLAPAAEARRQIPRSPRDQAPPPSNRRGPASAMAIAARKGSTMVTTVSIKKPERGYPKRGWSITDATGDVSASLLQAARERKTLTIDHETFPGKIIAVVTGFWVGLTPQGISLAVRKARQVVITCSACDAGPEGSNATNAIFNLSEEGTRAMSRHFGRQIGALCTACVERLGIEVDGKVLYPGDRDVLDLLRSRSVDGTEKTTFQEICSAFHAVDEHVQKSVRDILRQLCEKNLAEQDEGSYRFLRAGRVHPVDPGSNFKTYCTTCDSLLRGNYYTLLDETAIVISRQVNRPMHRMAQDYRLCTACCRKYRVTVLGLPFK
ncbi:MAG: tetratricopeptide repeat protein [Candidatus Lokiarchaeota archaeon]|nr:tetratricopeptide repeat protein [Candidatus Lokiarchaeota archaeon]